MQIEAMQVVNQESRDGQAKACDHLLKEAGLLQL